MSDEATITAKLLLVQLQDDSHRLVVGIEINCPGCGRHGIEIEGSHIGTVSAILEDARQRFPELCGEAAPKTDETILRVDPERTKKAGLN